MGLSTADNIYEDDYATNFHPRDPHTCPTILINEMLFYLCRTENLFEALEKRNLTDAEQSVSDERVRRHTLCFPESQFLHSFSKSAQQLLTV